jgi:hypothetical protein
VSKTRNLSDLLDANGDVKSTALDNVPASNDASALTTGTLPNDRLSAVPNSALANSSITINGSATSLGGSATINTDVVNDTTPQLGGNLDTNGNNINFGDNDKAQFGASNDLQIYHDGSNSFIQDVGTGSLVLQGTNLLIRTNNGDNVITATENAEVTLAYDNATKLQTTSTGATVTGTLSATAFSGDGSALTGISGGKIGQVIQTVKGNVSSTTSSSYTQISGLTASITPSSSSSKVLVKIAMYIGRDTSSTVTFKAYRGGTIIGIGDADGVRERVSARISPDNIHWMFPVYYEYLDSPSTTSATTYSMYWQGQSGLSVYINRTSSNGNDTTRDQARPISTITLMEILP